MIHMVHDMIHMIHTHKIVGHIYDENLGKSTKHLLHMTHMVHDIYDTYDRYAEKYIICREKRGTTTQHDLVLMIHMIDMQKSILFA